MNPLYSAIIGSIFRAVLIAWSGYLIEKRIITQNQGDSAVTMLMNQFTSALPALAALAWSFVQKHVERSKLMTALMIGKITEHQVNQHIDNGEQTPTVFTPKETIPGIPLLTQQPEKKENTP